MRLYYSVLISIVLVGTNYVHAQSFNAYLAFGYNISDDHLTALGKSQVGTRMGLNIGPGVSLKVHENWDMGMELLFSENGSYSNIDPIPLIALDKIVTRYVEVPVMLTYRFKQKQKEKQRNYTTSIGGGVSYAQLFDKTIIAVDNTDLSDAVTFDKQHTLLYQISATSFIRNSIALNGRGTISEHGNWTIALRLLFYLPNARKPT